MKYMFKLLLTLVILTITSMSTVRAQDAESVRAAIEKHYVAINAQDMVVTADHHLPEFTYFPPDRPLLWEANSTSAERMGASVDFGTWNAYMTGFKAQIYGDVAVATFYLVGTRTVLGETENGTTRVTAVWVWQGDAWKEAHHHESVLSGEDDD